MEQSFQITDVQLLFYEIMQECLSIWEYIEAELQETLSFHLLYFKVLLPTDSLDDLPVQDGEAHLGNELRLGTRQTVVDCLKLLVQLGGVYFLPLGFCLICILLVLMPIVYSGFCYLIKQFVYKVWLALWGRSIGCFRFRNAFHLIQLCFQVVHFDLEGLVRPDQSVKSVVLVNGRFIQDGVLVFEIILIKVVDLAHRFENHSACVSLHSTNVRFIATSSLRPLCLIIQLDDGVKAILIDYSNLVFPFEDHSRGQASDALTCNIRRFEAIQASGNIQQYLVGSG